jgi:hypothetical protein
MPLCHSEQSEESLDLALFVDFLDQFTLDTGILH